MGCTIWLFWLWRLLVRRNNAKVLCIAGGWNRDAKPIFYYGEDPLFEEKGGKIWKLENCGCYWWTRKRKRVLFNRGYRIFGRPDHYIMFTGRLSDKVKYKTIVKHKEKNHEQIIVDGEVYIEHRFLKKTIKIEDGKLTILPPDAPIEAGAEVYNATGRRVWNIRQCRKCFNRRSCCSLYCASQILYLPSCPASILSFSQLLLA